MEATIANPKPKAGWLRNPLFDLSFIAGIALIALASVAAVIAQPNLFLPILLLDLWFLGYHHVISTYTRLCFDRKSTRENRFFLIGLPPIVIAVVFSLAYGVGLWSIATIYFYWQWLHYTRQSWGVQQAYRRKSPFSLRENEQIAKAAFYLIPLWGILYRSYQDPGTFIGMELRVMPVPLLLVQIVALAALVTTAIWIWQRTQAFIRGEGPFAHTAYVASHITVFTTGYLLIDDITYGWLTINIWHNAQYVLFVWLYNTNKFRHGQDPSAGFLSKISQPGNWWIYFGVCLAISSLLYSSIDKVTSAYEALAIPIALVVYQSINFHHYIVDSFIWKLRKPSIRKNLDLADNPADKLSPTNQPQKS